MDKNVFEKMGIERDKKLFIQTFAGVNSKEKLEGFIESFGLNNFNETLKILDADDYRKVVGQVERIRIGL